MATYNIVIDAPFHVQVGDVQGEYRAMRDQELIAINGEEGVFQIVDPSDDNAYSVLMDIQTVVENLYYNDSDFDGLDDFLDAVSLYVDIHQ